MFYKEGFAMSTTVGQLLSELEKPENESEIKHLVHLKNLDNLEGLKQKSGIGGLFTRVILRFAKKHMEAFMVLSKCQTITDIIAFKQTEHYEKIRSTEVGQNFDIKDLARLEELNQLKDVN